MKLISEPRISRGFLFCQNIGIIQITAAMLDYVQAQGVLMVEPYKLALSKERDWLIGIAESKYGSRKTMA